MIITFSGLDGSGKTTLIKHLENYFDCQKIPYRSCSIYGQLSVYAILRSLRPHSSKHDNNILKQRKDKSLTYKFFRSRNAKKFFLLIDIIILYFIKLLNYFSNRVLIIDRYFYDFIMEITDDIKLYQRIVCFLFPSANISFFIDTDPKIAHSRKGEYDIETLSKRRRIYDKLFKYHSIDYYINNNDDSNAKSQMIEIIKSEIK